MTAGPFGALAPLRTRPIPDQAAARAAKKGYRDHPVAAGSAPDREPLVDLSARGLAGRNHYAHSRNPPYYQAAEGAMDRLLARQGVADRLAGAQARLGAGGLRLYLHDAWRPNAVQSFFHDRWVPGALRAARPDWSDDQVAAETARYWSAPTADPGSPAPHLTGGAVDLSLRWTTDDQPLWTGSLFDDVGEVSHLDYFERASPAGLHLSDDEARANRRLLYWVMTEAGFAANPDEWWHFSWGDQMWARLTGEPAALYGGTEPHE